MRWPVLVLAVLASIFVVASAAASVTATAAPVAPRSSESAPISTDAVPLPSASSPKPLPLTTQVSVTLTLSNPHSEALNRFLAQVEDPASPSYRHFLSYAQFVSDYSPPRSSAAEVEAALQGAGASDIAVAPDRSSVAAVLPAAAVEHLLGVQLVSYGAEGRMPLYTAIGKVSLPPALEGLVSGVGGLSDAATLELASLSHPSSLARAPASGPAQFVHDNATGDWFVGSDYAQAYGATDLFPGAHSVPNATYPTHVAIATLLGSSYNDTSGANLPPWDPAVIDAYFNGTLGPGWPTSNITGVPVSVNGVVPPLPGSLGNQNDSSLDETENSLDVEMAGSLAPGAPIYNFYFAGSLLAGNVAVGDVADYLYDDLVQALAYNYAPAHLAVVSISFGLPDLTDSAWNTELLTAASMGVTVVSASGDQGNAPDSLTNRGDGQWPVWPASAATNTSGSLSVGGVTLGLTGTPTSYWNGTSLNLSYDPDAGTIASMSTWYDTTGGPGYYAGSEGGVSTVDPEPDWQLHSAAQPSIVNATVQQGASALGRAEPDVAMPGNLTLVLDSADATGAVFFDVLEGTSVAAPVLAGLLADVVAVENNGTPGPWTSLGFIDPEVYRIASYFAQNPGEGGDPFLEVTSGANYVFSAAPGWNPTTGWGGVYAPALLAVDRNATVLNFIYTGPTPGLPPGYHPPSGSGGSVPWVYIYAIFGVGIVVAIVLVVLAARPARRGPASMGVPWGAQLERPDYRGSSSASTQRGSYPGTTFQCPYCGTTRPSEPVRCPGCGAY